MYYCFRSQRVNRDDWNQVHLKLHFNIVYEKNTQSYSSSKIKYVTKSIF